MQRCAVTRKIETNCFCRNLVISNYPVVWNLRHLAKKYFRNHVNGLSRKIWILTRGIFNNKENDLIKVPLTPKIVFRWYKFPFSPDHHCEKIIVVAIFVNFLRIFNIYNLAYFPCSRPRNSGEWDELASDVISGITMFWFWEEYMRAYDSVSQNRCRMHGIWVVGDCSNTGYAG